MVEAVMDCDSGDDKSGDLGGKKMKSRDEEEAYGVI